MNIHVQCYGVTRRLAGAEVVTVSVEDGSTVADVLAALAQRGDDFAQVLRQCAVASGDELVRRTHRLKSGDEIALLPPVAGG
ncbi:MoaD/ThiS family protein [Fontimonas sp. SYSU GA230001]|uniref:MoaD/ThiS family protein n=1 Tax=Fontimonas sp. SYSU GA230001 TaxID=3142450 RepID=UPI0032B46675